jgi:putative addiction module component (TIGR02574 family)
MIDKSDIEKMSLSERLEAMELLWDSISDNPENISSPAWHAEVLKKRETKVESGEAEFLTISEVENRFR